MTGPLLRMNQILAGARGVFNSKPDLGVLTVDPVFPGSFQAMRRSQRWQCHTANGAIVYVPYREFILLSDLDPTDERYVATPEL